MIIRCEDLDRALRTPELMPEAREHAAQCEKCRRQLYLWNEISRLAPQLHEEWESPDLLPNIRAALQAARPRPDRRPVWRWMVVAAAAAILLVVAATPWLRRSQDQSSPEFLTDSALREVNEAETAYARSIEKLSAIVEPRLRQSSSPLAAAYREKLVLIDSSIADLKTSLAGNPYNTYLRTELASLYQQKQKTLQDWMQNAKNN